MSDANLNLIISLALMLIAIVSVWKDVYNNNPPRNFIGRFTPAGRLLLLASFVFMFVNYFKDVNTERKVKIADLAKNNADAATVAIQKQLTQSQEKLKESQDSLYKLQISARETILQRVDSSYTKSLKASNEALAKYHVKIIDSLHTVVGTLKINSAHPQLALAPIANNRPPVFLNSDGSDTLKFQFIAANSTCFNIHVEAYYFLDTDHGDQLLYKDTLFTDRVFINTDVTSTIACQVRADLLALPRVLIVLYGSFSRDAMEDDKIPYLEAVKFDFRNNRFLEKPMIIESKFKALIGLK